MAFIVRLYSDITTAARRKRLTEHDIRLIEMKVISLITNGQDFADEFKTFEADTPRANVLKTVKDLCDILRTNREKNITERR